ncbi:MAG: J domain-containing protein [Halobacteriaceae archaeon]
MAVEWLPEWLAWGLLISGVLTVVFAAVFVAGERLLQSPADARGAASRDAGEWKRRREIRAFLGAAGEQYVEDQAVGGQRVAFYLPERGVAITFDAQAYFRLEAAGTTAILVEHEMPGAHLGARLPFETAVGGPDGRETGAPRDGRRAGEAFRTLGLPPDADPAAVRAAYRERVKAVHPDHGGDEAAFQRVREAYTAARAAAEARADDAGA